MVWLRTVIWGIIWWLSHVWFPSPQNSDLQGFAHLCCYPIFRTTCPFWNVRSIARVQFMWTTTTRVLVEIIWKVPMDNDILTLNCANSSYKFRKFSRMWGSGIHQTKGLWAWPCVLPGTGQGFVYELKQMMNCKMQRKKPLCWFFISIAMSQLHMMVSFKVTSAGEDNKESWAEHESTLSANSLPLSWILYGSSGRIMTFYLLLHRGWILFWKHLFPTEVS